MKYTLLLNILVLAQLISAQSFTEALQDPPLTGANGGSVDFADVNGDGYSDLLITGGSAKLYINDGMGNFTEKMDTPFPLISSSDAAFSDVNNDGHPDAFMMGSILGPEAISKLYINDGLGNFTERLTSDFVGLTYGSVAFEDVDRDGDQDLLTVGYTGADVASSGDFVSILYLNDGLGNFTEKENTPFEGVARSAVAFADVNGDGYPDLFTTGTNNSSLPVPKLYINNGSGDFTERLDIPFFEAERGSVAFADFNGNGHMDLIITGRQNSLKVFSKLYLNDGDGQFTELLDTPFEGVSTSSVAVADVNQNGHMDIFLMGFALSGRSAKLYLNDGDANFTEVLNTSFRLLFEGDSAFEDVNSDGYPDLLITGNTNLTDDLSILYINDGMVSSQDTRLTERDANFKLYPNPTRAQEFFVEFHSDKRQTIFLSLYDVNGLQVSQQQETALPGTHVYGISVPSLPAGQYIVVLNDGRRPLSKTITVE